MEINLLTNALYKTLTAPDGTVVTFPELDDVLNIRSTKTQTSTNRTPLKLHIFDFDGTLFSSPEPNFAIWESRLVGYLKNERKIFKGWYQDIRSLQGCALEGCALENRWNNELVDTVKLSMDVKNDLTVLLTGRSYNEFHVLITEIIERKGMKFDVMGFKPKDNVLDWNLYYKTNIIKKIGEDRYNELMTERTVIDEGFTTKKFKLEFIKDLISHHPSIDSI